MPVARRLLTSQAVLPVLALGVQAVTLGEVSSTVLTALDGFAVLDVFLLVRTGD